MARSWCASQFSLPAGSGSRLPAAAGAADPASAQVVGDLRSPAGASAGWGGRAGCAWKAAIGAPLGIPGTGGRSGSGRVAAGVRQRRPSRHRWHCTAETRARRRTCTRVLPFSHAVLQRFSPIYAASSPALLKTETGTYSEHEHSGKRILAGNPLSPRTLHAIKRMQCAVHPVDEQSPRHNYACCRIVEGLPGGGTAWPELGKQCSMNALATR